MKHSDDFDLDGLLAGLASAGLSRREIARRGGLSKSYVIDLATGYRGRGRISYSTVRKLQRVADEVQARPRA